jgi:hypothetical protein
MHYENHANDQIWTLSWLIKNLCEHKGLVHLNSMKRDDESRFSNIFLPKDLFGTKTKIQKRTDHRSLP